MQTFNVYKKIGYKGIAILIIWGEIFSTIKCLFLIFFKKWKKVWFWSSVDMDTHQILKNKFVYKLVEWLVPTNMAYVDQWYDLHTGGYLRTK